MVGLAQKDSAIDNKIKELEDKLTGLVTKQIQENIPLALYQEEFNKIQNEISKLKQEKAQLGSSITATINKSNFDAELRNFMENRTLLTPRVVSSVIKRIYRLVDNSVLLIINKEDMNLTQFEGINFNDKEYLNLEPHEICNDKKKLTYRLLYWRNNK